MAYTYISVWRDGQPYVAFDIPDHTLIGESWAPPLEVRPSSDGPHTEPRAREWRDVLRRLKRYQDCPRYELSESFTAWQRGWGVDEVRP